MKRPRHRMLPSGVSAKLLAMAEWFAGKTEAMADTMGGFATRTHKDGADEILVTVDPWKTFVRVKSAGLFMITTRFLGGSTYEIKTWNRACEALATFNLSAPVGGFLAPFIAWDGSKGAAAGIDNVGGTNFATETAAIAAGATAATVVTVNPVVTPMANNVGQYASGLCRDLYSHELFPQTGGLNAITVTVADGLAAVTATALAVGGEILPYTNDSIPPAQLRDGYQALTAFGGYNFSIPQNRYLNSRAAAYVMRAGVWSTETYDDQALATGTFGGRYVLRGGTATMSDDGLHTVAAVARYRDLVAAGAFVNYNVGIDVYFDAAMVATIALGPSVGGNETGGQPIELKPYLWVNQNGSAAIVGGHIPAYNGQSLSSSGGQYQTVVWSDGSQYPIVAPVLNGSGNGSGTDLLQPVGITNDRQLAVFHGSIDGGVTTQRFHFYRFTGSGYTRVASTTTAITGTCFFNPVNGKVFVPASTCREVSIDDDNVVTVTSTAVVGGPIGTTRAVAASLI